MEIKIRSKKHLLYRKVYQVWRDMTQRCLNPINPYYKNYGAKGITVAERWKVLSNFIEDVDKICGFNKVKFLNRELVLDKDGDGINGTIYSLENCRFISLAESNKMKPHQQKWFKAIAPNGKIYEAYNQSDFALEHGLRQTSISDCLVGRLKTHRKWKFELIE